MPSIASALFNTHYEPTASELKSSVEATQAQSALPSRSQNGTQTASASITTTSLMPDLSSFATSAFVTPTATTYTSVMTTRKFGDDIDNPSPDHHAIDPKLQASVTVGAVLSTLAMLLLVLFFVLRCRRRSQAVEQHSSMHASDIARELESNPLLADWAQGIGSKSGLQLLAEKVQGYDGDEYPDRTSVEIGAFPPEYAANESQRSGGSDCLEETFSHPESPTSEAGPSTRWHTR